MCVPKISRPKATQHAQLQQQEHRARDEERQKKMATTHGRHGVAAEQIAFSGEHQIVTNAPHAAAHQVQTNQAWQQKIDVASALLAHLPVIDS